MSSTVALLPFIKPTAMLLRNLMAMDVEEMIRGNPIDAVVLLCGCDKTTPAQLMGAASADLPAIMVTGRPQLKGNWRGQEVGAEEVWITIVGGADRPTAPFPAVRWEQYRG